MGYRAEILPLWAEPNNGRDDSELDQPNGVDRQTLLPAPDSIDPATIASQPERMGEAESKGAAEELGRRREIEWLGEEPFGSNLDSTVGERSENSILQNTDLY